MNICDSAKYFTKTKKNDTNKLNFIVDLKC